MISIKSELVGSWKLLSYIEITTDGTDSFFPLGNDVSGILIYSADGYMSVMISGSGNPVGAKKPNAEASSGRSKPQSSAQPHFLAFSGTYRVDNRNATVVHNVYKSLSSNLEGKDVERRIDFEGDILYLKSTRPVFSNGKMVNSYMTWRRMERQELTKTDAKVVKFGSKKMEVV